MQANKTQAASDLAGKALRQELSTPASTTSRADHEAAIDRRWISALFAKFAARWGSKWTAHLDTERMLEIARAQWAEDLAGMTAEQIGIALKASRDLAWPPSPGEFRQLGIGKALATPNAAMYRQAPKRLPRPPRSEAEIEAGRQALKLALKGVTNDA